MSKHLKKADLERLQAKLLKDEEHLKHRIEELKSEDPFANPDHAYDNAAVDTDVREKTGHEIIEAQVNSLGRKLHAVEDALGRMKRGTYGSCRRCYKIIKIARLKFLPESRYCIVCERKLVA